MKLGLLALLLMVPLLGAAADEEGPLSLEDAAREALELEARQVALDLLVRDAEAKLAELTRLREEMAELLQPAEEEATTDLATLIQFYQAMKPKKAASLLEKLPPDLAAELLGSMKSRQAGKILDVMAPAKAVRISRLMAGGAR